MSFLLSCHSLKRQLGDRVLLSVDHLQLERGRTYLLSGANGAGKTTLLRAVMGALEAKNGGIEFDGVDLGGGPGRRRAQLGTQGRLQSCKGVPPGTPRAKVALAALAA